MTDEEKRLFRLAYAMNVALAKELLAKDNMTCGTNWPAGQEWGDLVGSSRSTYMRLARERAGITDHNSFLAPVRSGEVDVEDIYLA